MTRLGDVAEILRGVTFKPSQLLARDSPGAVACLRTKNVQAKLDTSDVLYVPSSAVKRRQQYVLPGDIIISSANSWNLVGKCSWVDTVDHPTTFGGFVSDLRVDGTKAEARYVYHWFNSDMVQRQVRSFGQQTTNISNLNVARTLDLELPLPPLPEQRRIASILDKVDDLRTKRRVAIVELESLNESEFETLWKSVRDGVVFELSTILERIDSGTSPVCMDRPAADDEWAVLKLGAISTGRYIAKQNKALLAGVMPDKRHEVRAGDVLLSRKNTPELVGASVYVRETPPRILLPDLIFRLVLRENGPVRARYLQRALAHASTRRVLRGIAGGSAASMSNISKERLGNVRLAVPSMESQLALEERLNDLEDLSARHEMHLTKLDELFASLQHRAFRGEL